MMSPQDILSGGYWATGAGGIKRWVQVEDEPDETDDLFATLAKNLARPLPRPICDVCGCLLMRASEPCPSCLAWAIHDAVVASWRAARVPYGPGRGEQEVA